MSQVNADISELETAMQSLQQIKSTVEDQQGAANSAAEVIANAWTDVRGQRMAKDCRESAQTFGFLLESLDANLDILLRKIEELKAVLET